MLEDNDYHRHSYTRRDQMKKGLNVMMHQIHVIRKYIYVFIARDLDIVQLFFGALLFILKKVPVKHVLYLLFVSSSSPPSLYCFMSIFANTLYCWCEPRKSEDVE